MRDVTLLSMKNKSVQLCQFVHHAKFRCIMTTLNKLFKIDFERWGGNRKRAKIGIVLVSTSLPYCAAFFFAAFSACEAHDDWSRPRPMRVDASSAAKWRPTTS